jgi:pimeloyl-ACP methyl ester carboxylesterase
MKKIRFSVHAYAIIATLILFSSCKKDDPSPAPGPIPVNPGELVGYELIDTLTIPEIEEIRTARLTEFLSTATIKADAYVNRLQQPQNAVILYRVTYKSIIPEQGNRSTTATGLVAIPLSSNRQLPVISYQHGTVFGKNQVPSNLPASYETMFMVLQFASQGYVLFAPDYFGLGSTSPESNSYFVRYSTEQACLDLYRAGQKVLAAENVTMSKFFINGWSQGAYNTMLFLRRLEQENIPVKAAFTAAAPVDPPQFVARGLFNPRPFDAPYAAAALCNKIFSIEKYNNLSGISTAYIRPKYYNPAKDFHEFKISFEQLLDTVPVQLDSVFTAQFYKDARGISAPFWNILANSEAYRWLSPTPLRAYYGMKDEAVPDFIASMAVDYMARLGKQNGQAINAGAEADHRATYIESLADAKSWIDGF